MLGRVDIGLPSAHAALEEWAMLIRSKSVRNPANEMALVGVVLSRADLSAVRKGTGAALRTLYSDV